MSAIICACYRTCTIKTVSQNSFNKIAARNIVSLGGKFFIIQLCLLVINATNQWLIIKLATPENVVDYQLYYKVFEIAPVVFALFTQPIWSAVTTALSENRLAWIRKSYRILNMIALLGTGACACVALVLQPLFDIWLGNESIAVNPITAMLFVLFAGLQTFYGASTCIANGMSCLRFQLISCAICAILKFSVTVLLFRVFPYWETVILVHIMLYIIMIGFQLVDLKKLFRPQKQIVN